MRRLPPQAAWVLAVLAPLRAADLAAALSLAEAKRLPEAQEALAAIVAAEPKNAAACHHLGRVLGMRTDAAALEEAVKWHGRAVELEPSNAVYVGAYGGALLNAANKSRSLSAALKGRDMLEKAIVLDPALLDAREALFRFYYHAPWPIGSNSKAYAQLAAMRKIDPIRADGLSVISKVDNKDYTGAFKTCEELLAADPANYVALYQYGRTAAISGQNLERGRSCLKACLALPPPSPAAPTPSAVWQRIGNIEEKLQRIGDARSAYESALKLDPSNRQAQDGLARTK